MPEHGVDSLIRRRDKPAWRLPLRGKEKKEKQTQELKVAIQKMTVHDKFYGNVMYTTVETGIACPLQTGLILRTHHTNALNTCLEPVLLRKSHQHT